MFTGRLLTSMLTGALGAAGGLAIAFERGTSGCNGPRGFCGISADYGALWMAGALIPSAALGAAMPTLGSSCRFGKRFTRAIVAAAVGGGGGALLGLAGSRGTRTSLTYLGSTIGSTIAVHRCR